MRRISHFGPGVVCFGDMGVNEAFYIHSDVWFRGKISVFKSGYIHYAMDIWLSRMYFSTGGMAPSWACHQLK